MNTYQHRTWAVAVRHWRGQQARGRTLACARCGGPIARVQGTDKSLDVGHITARVIAVQLGWSVEEINAISNTQPEHRGCNRTAGAELGNQLRARARPPVPVTTREW